ncbi:hypothetical protein BDV12DRAFT_194548 [Aspergillus spectabilis]
MPPPPLHSFNLLPKRDADTTPTHLTGTGNTISIPSTYGRQQTSPGAGVIVGATLGAVAGFLFILYLLYLSLTSGRRFSASTITGTSMSGTTHTPSEIVDVGFRRPKRGRRGGRGGGEVIVEEDATSESHGGGNVVEVIEEESVVDPPPSSRYRSRSRSRSGSWSSEGGGRRSYRRGGVREVDPMAYGGGSEFSARS